MNNEAETSQRKRHKIGLAVSAEFVQKSKPRIRKAAFSDCQAVLRFSWMFALHCFDMF